jgi:hypothetical protein
MPVKLFCLPRYGRQPWAKDHYMSCTSCIEICGFTLTCFSQLEHLTCGDQQGYEEYWGQGNLYNLHEHMLYHL